MSLLNTRWLMGNWKMYGLQEDLDTRLLDLRERSWPMGVVVLPPICWLTTTIEALKDTGITVGAQDCSGDAALEGAFTGEVSAQMLASAKAQWVLIGHSERRLYHAEQNPLLLKKLTHALEAGIRPILCIGECAQERADWEAVLTHQLSILTEAKALQGEIFEIFVAYEPVWAIGASEPAGVSDIEKVHHFLGQWLAKAGWDASSYRLLYGGAVSCDNVSSLMQIDGVHGVLVGRASLDPNQFWEMATCIHSY